jgi:hypothetical protein
MGLVIGYVAVQTESLWPCVLLHGLHNSLQVCVRAAAMRAASQPNSLLFWLIGGEEPRIYHPAVAVVCGVGAAAILWRLRGLEYRRTAEERLEEQRQQQDVVSQALA